MLWRTASPLRFKFHVLPGVTTEIKRVIEMWLGSRLLGESMHRVTPLGVLRIEGVNVHFTACNTSKDVWENPHYVQQLGTREDNVLAITEGEPRATNDRRWVR